MWRCFYFTLLILVARDSHSFTGVTNRRYIPAESMTSFSSFYKRTLYDSRVVIQRHTAIFSESPQKTKSFVQVLEETGQKLMPMALEAKGQSLLFRSQYTSTQENRLSLRVQSWLYSLKSCALFSLFIIYRAYRGFFVLLPAVFRQSYAKLKAAVDSPFVEEDEDDDDKSLAVKEDVNPKTGSVRLRTQVVVSILSMIVVASFVMNGAWEVLLQFLSTIRKTSSIETSFEAAAEKVLINEDKVQKYTVKRGQVNGDP